MTLATLSHYIIYETRTMCKY